MVQPVLLGLIYVLQQRFLCFWSNYGVPLVKRMFCMSGNCLVTNSRVCLYSILLLSHIHICMQYTSHTYILGQCTLEFRIVLADGWPSLFIWSHALMPICLDKYWISWRVILFIIHQGSDGMTKSLNVLFHPLSCDMPDYTVCS